MIVEILDRRGSARQRIRLPAFPATVGRGYENDVILDDRYVERVHARVEWDGAGTLVLADQQSLNGIIDPTTGQRVSRLVIRSGIEARLGRTTIRFIDAAHPVVPALLDSPLRSETLLGQSPVRSAALVLITGALLALHSYLGEVGRVRLSGILGEALTALLLLAAWAGGWALVSRLTQQRFRFLEHLGIASAAVAAFLVLTSSIEYIQFLFPHGMAWDTGSAVLGFVVATATLAAHLARVSGMPPRNRWLWSGAVIGALVVVAALTTESEPGSAETGLGDTPLKPLAARWIPSVAPGQFLSEVEKLKGKVDDLADDQPDVEPDSSAPVTE